MKKNQPKMLRRKTLGDTLFPYLLITPYFILLAIFTFYPVVNCIWLTFHATNQIGQAGAWTGLRFWKRVVQKSEFSQAILTTFKYGGLLGVGTFSLAMLLSYLSVKQVKGSKVYQTLFSLPMAMATVPVAAIYSFVFDRYGIVNRIFGTTRFWLADTSVRFWIIVLVTIWCNCGSSFLYLLVGFRAVPEELIESADLDGAGPFKKFFNVYVPIASPQIFFVVFLNILSAFKSFTMIKILVGTEDSEVCNLMCKLYYYAFVKERYETGCIYALVLSVLIFLVSRIQFFFEKKVVIYA
ncbi:MAG: sugar ABC transporter permease [Sphaerochaetaceae bacterium]|nr:sugar ABC transporter permease [Sphaerochaetaceae bacterium]